MNKDIDIHGSVLDRIAKKIIGTDRPTPDEYSRGLEAAFREVPDEASAIEHEVFREVCAEYRLDFDSFVSRRKNSDDFVGEIEGFDAFRETPTRGPAPVVVRNVEVFRAGNYGRKGRYTAVDLAEIARSYRAERHEAAVTTDHEQKGPAYGWVTALTARGNSLFMDATLSADFFAQIKSGAWRKRSVEIYRPATSPTGKPYLKAVTFLGASAPHVKGMADPTF